MVQKNKFIWGFMIGIVCFLFFHILPAEASEENIELAKNGIVEVQSGFLDKQDNFVSVKSGSGFLIRNTQENTYIITSQTTVKIADKEKEKYLEKAELESQNDISGTIIKIVVKGDVMIDASIVAESKEKDFCVLSTENSVNEKNALCLEDVILPQIEDKVYSLEFSDDEHNQQYISQDVVYTPGLILANDTNKYNVTYICHNAGATKGNIGSPLLNEQGYVIGVNTGGGLPETDKEFHALPISEVIEVLNNFGIVYEGNNKIQWSTNFYNLYDKCEKAAEDSSYTNSSKKKLKEVLENLQEMKNQEDVPEEELKNGYEQLKQAQEFLKKKPSKLHLLIIGLAVLIVISFIYWCVLFVLYKKETKSKERIEGHSIKGHSVLENDNRNIPKKERTFQTKVSKGRFVLVQKSTGKETVLAEREMIIGKNKTIADICISDNKMVSREHAAIRIKDGKIYIRDLNSLNGTFVHGKRISEGKLVEIFPGEDISFANESYCVKEYTNKERGD